MTTPRRDQFRRPGEWIALSIRYYAEPALALAGPLAECLLNRLTAYSFEQHTDGAVDMPALWAVAGNLASVCSIPEELGKLVEHGLLQATGERTWRIVGYLDWQPTAERYLADRQSATAKRQRFRLMEKARKERLEQANRLHASGRHQAAEALARTGAGPSSAAATQPAARALSPGDTPSDASGDTPCDALGDNTHVTGGLSSPTPTPGVLSRSDVGTSSLRGDDDSVDVSDHADEREPTKQAVQALLDRWRSSSISYLPERIPEPSELDQVASSAAVMLETHTYAEVEDVAEAAGRDGVTDLGWWHQKLDQHAGWCPCATKSA